MRDKLLEIKKYVEKAKKICITSHIKIDGDGLGSEVALARAFSKIGKEVKIINDSKVPYNLHFILKREDEIEIYEENKHFSYIKDCDLIFVLDVALIYRLGKLAEPFLKSKAIKVCIDHHLEGEEVFDIKISEKDASSTGELVYKLLKEMNLGCQKDIAEALFASIMVDSGSLSYERCTPEIYNIVSELVRCGADPYETHINLHWKKSYNELLVEKEVISNLNVENVIAYSFLKKDLKEELSIDPLELPDLVHIPLSLKDAEIALLFIENGDGEIKVSVRSKGKVKICELAKIFGGGGHPLAAGFVVKGELESVIREVIDKTKKIFNLT